MPTLSGISTWATNGIPPAYTLPTNTAPTPGVSQWYEPPPTKGSVRTPALRVGPSRRIAGRALPLFGDLFWFEHIHLIPQQLVLGNILADQTRSFEVFNAYRGATKTIATLVQDGTTGITITAGDPSPPVAIGAYKSEHYTLTISRVGPVRLIAHYVFGMASGESLSLLVTGNRAIVWPYIPQGAFREVHEFMTDVIESDDGSEQRMSLRDVPRQSYTYRYKFADEELNARAENLLVDWAARVFALPIWQDHTTLTAQATAGAGNVTLNVASTTDRDFRAGAGELVLLYAGEFSFEALEVVSFTSTTITVSIGPGSTWPAGTRVVPIRLSFLIGQPRQRTWPTRARDLQLSFEANTMRGYPDDASFSSYLGSPVFVDSMRLASGAQDRAFALKVERMDSGTGRAFQDSSKRFLPLSMAFLADFESRTEQWRLKRFLHARRGKFKSFWLPTWRAELAVHSTAIAPTNTIFVKAAKYSDHAWNANRQSRQHLMIEYANGQRDFRRVTAAALTSPGVLETLTLDSNVSQDVSVANVVRIAFLLRVRLSNDSIEFNHDYAYNGEVGIAVTEVDL